MFVKLVKGQEPGLKHRIPNKLEKEKLK